MKDLLNKLGITSSKGTLRGLAAFLAALSQMPEFANNPFIMKAAGIIGAIGLARSSLVKIIKKLGL